MAFHDNGNTGKVPINLKCNQARYALSLLDSIIKGRTGKYINASCFSSVPLGNT